MKLKKFLQGLDFSPSADDMEYLKKETERVVGVLKEEIKKVREAQEVFVGGSFAKGTLAKSEKYDVDIFVRFDLRYDDISALLEGIIKRAEKKLGLSVKKIHGSRDYFSLGNGKIEFEIIPVSRIKKPREARNVTDLSYFHVNYVKRKLKGKLIRELLLAKQFCEAQEVYGAESYIKGFSGYGLECLIIFYKSFEKMLKELSKSEERLIIDPEKKYKRKGDVLIEMNESRLHSPIILVDPTWRERNALAALSYESFTRFREAAKGLIKSPSMKYFEVKDVDVSKLRKKKGEFLQLKIMTDRQEGDIAGTKMKKFAGFLERELGRYFEILAKEFKYGEGKRADFYLVLKSRGEIFRIGPSIKMKENAEAFRKANKNVFEKNGFLHAREKIDFSGKEFIEKWSRGNRKKMAEMGISDVKIISRS